MTQRKKIEELIQNVKVVKWSTASRPLIPPKEKKRLAYQIETLITEGKIEEHELIYSHAPDYESEWMAERWNELQASLKGETE